MKRVMVFVDGSNLYHGLRENLGRTNVGLKSLVNKLVGPDRELVRTYYYNCPIERADGEDEYKRQQRFFDSIHRIEDLEVCLGRLARRPDGKRVEKGVDVRLAVDMLSKAFKDHYDVAVLISADGDFAELVQAVKDAGKKVEIAYPKRPYHLANVADRFTCLDAQLLADCWLTSGAK